MGYGLDITKMDKNGTKSTLKMAKKIGLNTIWFESGNKKGEENYKDDDLDGPFIEWNEDGSIKYKATFKDGVLVEKDGEDVG